MEIRLSSLMYRHMEGAFHLVLHMPFLSILVSWLNQVFFFLEKKCTRKVGICALEVIFFL